MLAAADSGIPAADLRGAVGYDGPWLGLATAALGLMVLYYLALWWWGNRRLPSQPADPRAEHLALLDAIEADVAAGRIDRREGHRRVSEVVRAYAARISDLPAPTMTLAELRAAGPAGLADVVALVYPPEFSPEAARDGGLPAEEQLDETLVHARELVSTWS